MLLQKLLYPVLRGVLDMGVLTSEGNLIIRSLQLKTKIPGPFSVLFQSSVGIQK